MQSLLSSRALQAPMKIQSSIELLKSSNVNTAQVNVRMFLKQLQFSQH